MQSCVLVNVNSTKAFFKIENIIRNSTFKVTYKGTFYSKQREAKIQTKYLRIIWNCHWPFQRREQTVVFQEILIEKGNWFGRILCDRCYTISHNMTSNKNNLKLWEFCRDVTLMSKSDTGNHFYWRAPTFLGILHPWYGNSCITPLLARYIRRLFER